jgi:SAM-dependent methyltransferase
MTQNIYDDDGFFAAYGGLARSVDGLDGAPEWPALRALLPPMTGLRALDLGCGYGWFCRWARAQGAARVLGIDVSDRMLARARREPTDPAIEYRRADLETVALPTAAFDVVYSALALHYVARLAVLVAAVHRALVPGGRFVFSAEHPIYTAPSSPGFQTAAAGTAIWPLDRYLEEGPRTVEWLGARVEKHHRTLGTLLNTLVRAGLRLAHVEEWRPTDADLAGHPEWARERDRPMFVLVAAHKDASERHR